MDNLLFNITTQNEFTKLIAEGIPYDYAFIMACDKGGQQHLSKNLIDRMREDQEILERETLAHLVPFEPTPVITTEAVVIESCPSSGAEKNNNDL